jgi:hypothetical protein
MISFLSCSKSGQKGNADAPTALVNLTNAFADKGDTDDHVTIVFDGFASNHTFTAFPLFID